jgi:hypothetical protein
VVEIEELEDEGPGYIFDLGDGRSLFLKGRRFAHAVGGPWPNSEFDIIRTVAAGLWIGLFCRGHRLTPTRLIENRECDPRVILSEHEDVVDGSPLEYANKITAYRARSSGHQPGIGSLSL